MIYGIGESVYDIIFPAVECGQLPVPRSAVPGGSVFNAIVSLGRMGAPCTMITQVGDDRVGELTRSYLTENGVDVSFVRTVPGMKSHISLAYLNADNDAEYTFYKDHTSWLPSADEMDIEFHAEDILLLSSFYAVNPVTRPQVRAILERAHSAGAFIYYDINYRRSHRQDLDTVMPAMLENIALASVVRASSEDLEVIGFTPSSRHLIITDGPREVMEQTDNIVERYAVEKIETVSTVGAGDNFNAGYIYATERGIVGKERIAIAMRFAQNVCQSLENSVTPNFVINF